MINSRPHSAEVGPVWTDTGPESSKFGPNSAEISRFQAGARFRAAFGRKRSSLVRSWSRSGFGRIRPSLDHTHSKDASMITFRACFGGQLPASLGRHVRWRVILRAFFEHVTATPTSRREIEVFSIFGTCSLRIERFVRLAARQHMPLKCLSLGHGKSCPCFTRFRRGRPANFRPSSARGGTAWPSFPRLRLHAWTWSATPELLQPCGKFQHSGGIV